MKISCLATLLLSLFLDKGFCTCLDGLPSSDDLKTATLDNVDQLVIRFRQLRLFPSLNFTCSGAIISWKLAAPSVRNGGGRPELSIWRQGSGNKYIKVAAQFLDASLTEDISTNSTDIHIHTNTLDTPLLFQPGDVLGLLLRRQSVVRFTPYLLPDASGSLSYYTTTSGSPENDTFKLNQNNADSLLPVLTFEICTCSSETSTFGNDNCASPSLQSALKCPTPEPPTVPALLPTSSPTTSSSAPTPTISKLIPEVTSGVVSPAPQAEESTTIFAREILIVTIALPCGIVILALLLILVIVLSCFWYKKGSSGQHTISEEPAYSTVSSPHLQTVDIKAALEMRAIYERELTLTQSPTYETILPKDFPPPYTPHDDNPTPYATVGERL